MEGGSQIRLIDDILLADDVPIDGALDEDALPLVDVVLGVVAARFGDDFSKL
jgi:hypothetical protein